MVRLDFAQFNHRPINQHHIANVQEQQ